jgi:hypothetical protein
MAAGNIAPASKLQSKAGKRVPGHAAQLEGLMLDQTLQWCGKTGLNYFQGQLDKLLIVAIDRASTGAMLVFYLSQVILLWFIFDVFHRCWDDAQDGVKQAGLWCLLVEIRLCFTLVLVALATTS